MECYKANCPEVTVNVEYMGESFAVAVNAGDTVSKLKQVIAKKLEEDLGEYDLMLDGVPLPNGKNIGELEDDLKSNKVQIPDQASRTKSKQEQLKAKKKVEALQKLREATRGKDVTATV